MLTRKEKDSIVELFKALSPVSELAKEYGVSRQAIYKILKKNKVDAISLGIILVQCATCGADLSRHRYRVRKQKNHFCDYDCFASFLKAYIGPQAIPRLKVSEHFDLQPEHIIHFKDNNPINTMIYNLAVFKNQQDHIRFHHGMDDVEILWEG